jgi:hypothetical protein
MDLQFLLFDKYEPACLEIMKSMQKLAFLLLTAALAFNVGRQRALSPEAIVWPLLNVTILTAVIAAWPDLVGSQGMFWKITAELSREIEADAWTTYLGILAQHRTDWWDFAAFQRAAVTLGIISLVGLLGEVVMVLARAFQFFFLGFVLAFGPVFIALFGFQTTRGIAVRFVSTTIGLFLWDVAWKLVDLGTINLANAGALIPSGTPGNLLLISGWVILGYTFAPIAVTHALTAGGNVGGALLGSVAGGASKVMATTFGMKYAAAGLIGQLARPTPPPPSPPAAPTPPVPPTTPNRKSPHA